MVKLWNHYFMQIRLIRRKNQKCKRTCYQTDSGPSVKDKIILMIAIAEILYKLKKKMMYKDFKHITTL